MRINLLFLFTLAILATINASKALEFPQEFFNFTPNIVNVCSTTISISPTGSPISPTPPVPALFIIGDSSVDCGTNNYLGTFARADRLPYGRDFDTHQPTGRFCNGRIPVDYLGNIFLSFSWFRFSHLLPRK